jgi:hypothetical protein
MTATIAGMIMYCEFHRVLPEIAPQVPCLQHDMSEYINWSATGILRAAAIGAVFYTDGLNVRSYSAMA